MTDVCESAEAQMFLRELLDVLDDIPEKRLIGDALFKDGRCCALGALVRARGLGGVVTNGSTQADADALGVPLELMEEITGENDRYEFGDDGYGPETAAERFVRVRAWVASKIREAST